MSAPDSTTAPTWTIGRLLTWTTDFLRDKGYDSPRLDAEVLLASARDCPRIELYTAFAEEPTASVRTAFRELVRRRAEGTPVAYLVGQREFFSLPFVVTPAVLIPRPETELMVVRALDIWKDLLDESACSLADVGTGSGVLAVCCAKHMPTCHVTALDISPAALEVAGQNAVAQAVHDRIEFLESDLLAELPAAKQFDMILSNPPYVATSEMLGLPTEIRDYEPHLALDGGEQGVEVIQRLIPQAAARLRPGGWLLLEVGPSNAALVEQIVARAAGLERRQTINDLAEHPRIVQAQATPAAHPPAGD